MREDPKMPREVAEYQIHSMRRSYDSTPQFAREFANVTDTTTLRRLTAAEIAARWIEAKSSRYRIALAGARSPACKTVSGNEAMFPEPPRMVLGSIMRNDTAYVLHQFHGSSSGLHSSPIHVMTPQVAVLVRDANVWRIIPSYELFGPMGFIVSCDQTRVDSLHKF